MTEHLSGPPPTRIQVDATTGVRRRVTAMASQLWSETLAQHWPQHTRFGAYQFLLPLEPTRTGRLRSRTRQLRLLSTRITTADHALARRFGLRGPLIVRAVRQARLLGLVAKSTLRKLSPAA